MTVFDKHNKATAGAISEPIQSKLDTPSLKEEAPPKNYTETAVRVPDEIFKAFIPDYLYKPPFGYPHRVNLPYLKKLAATPSVFSIIKTLSDEASSLDWDIVPREDADLTPALENKIKDVKKFFRNPNGNEESWEHIQRSLIRDVLEIDAGVLVKVFNRKGELKQVFSRDGMTFLKNPDIYGYLGNRADFVFPAPMPEEIRIAYDNMRSTPHREMAPVVQQYYDMNYTWSAAYFQYGWTAGSMPKPFGKREIMYIMQNPKSDSVYGRSPVEMSADIIQTLLYGSLYNLDFYINGNMPEGMVNLPGAQVDQIKAFRAQFEKQFKFRDALDNERRLGYKFPITSIEGAQFVPFTFKSAEMQILEQQEWFSKILWMCFGVTPDEMGFTDTSNRAISEEQAKVFKRKAIRPLTNVLMYHINTQLLPEFFMDEYGDYAEAQDECPIMFKYIDYDVEEDIKRHTLLETQIRMGVKTAEMAAEELDINVEELKKQKEEAFQKQQERFEQQEGFGKEKEEEGGFGATKEEEEKPEKPEEEKSVKTEVIGEIDTYIKDVGKAIEKEIQDSIVKL